MSFADAEKPLRLRVFAGPNGSGKSTIIQSVKNAQVHGRPVDLGHYVNADDIAGELRRGSFSFETFSITATEELFQEVAKESGLVTNQTQELFQYSFSFHNNAVTLSNPDYVEQLAQILADFLRKRLLHERRRFSFETVFSHPSKLDIMRQAAAAGYKVYLYFVSTADPEINKSRVASRVRQGGHNVPEDKIESRYYRSLSLLYDACQIAYQTYFFDNSTNGTEFSLFAHFKLIKDKKFWDETATENLPNWFLEYYYDKAEVSESE